MSPRNPTSFFLARRLQLRPEGKKQSSLSVGIAVTGVALSIIVMMVSLAVMSGFKKEVKSRLMSVGDAITITAIDAYGEPSAFSLDSLKALISLPTGAEISPRIASAAILKTDDDFVALDLRASDRMVPADSSGSMALSATTASRLGLDTGDKIPVYFFIDNKLRVRNLRLDSIFSSGIDEHDSQVGYCSQTLLRRLLKLSPDEAPTFGITGLDESEIEPVANDIVNALLTAYYTGRTLSAFRISTILQTDASYFTWLDLLDTNVVVILTLMAAVAAFTLISSLFIIILERVKTIGLLKALGAGNPMIRHTFMIMAERLVVKGMLIGNLIALGLIAIQHFTRIIPLDPANYYVSFVPVSLTAGAVVALNIGVMAVSWVVLMLPAMVISRISPASTMRYE